MLEYMRKNANSTVVWLIIGAIAVVFIFFGVGGGGGGRYNKITVNGEEISNYDYDRMHKAVTRAIGNDRSPDTEKTVRFQTASELVSQTLINQFGRAVGLEPSDWALGKNIAAKPEFQMDGHFDRAKYESELSMMRTDKSYYEQSVRKELMGGRINGLIGGLAQVYSPAALEMFHYQEDQVAFDFVFFPAEIHLAGLNPDETGLTAYYTLNQEKWRRPTLMTVDYVEINPADYLDQVTVSDAELLESYEDNKIRFSNPEAAEVSHILIKFPRMNPDAKERREALERAEAAFERAQTEEFPALARELSEDTESAAEGGSLGQISRGMTFDNFEEEVFSAPIGTVSRPIETDIGYHLIKVDSRQAAGATSFSEVREKLLDEQKAIKARQWGTTVLEDLLIRVETNPKLAEAAASMGLTTKTSENFIQSQPLSFFEKEDEELKKAFNLPVGKVGTVENERYLVVYSPVSREESHIPPLTEIRDRVISDWKADEALRLAGTDAAGFLARAGASGWEAAAETLPNEAQVSRGRSSLSRRGTLMDIEPFNKVNTQDFMAAVHSVAKIGQISPLTVAGEESGRPGSFVLLMSDWQAADENMFKGQTGDMFKMMMSMNQANLIYQIWRGELYEASKDNIVVPKEYL